MKKRVGINGFGRFGLHIIKYWLDRNDESAFTINYINDDSLTINQSIEILKNPKHTNKIQLTDTIGLIMKYPNIKSMSQATQVIGQASSSNLYNLITDCIENVYDEDSVYNKSDYTKKELQEFVLNLTKNQFDKLESFFDTMPKIYKDVEFKCSCGFKETIRLEGLNSFFG